MENERMTFESIMEIDYAAEDGVFLCAMPDDARRINLRKVHELRMELGIPNDVPLTADQLEECMIP